MYLAESVAKLYRKWKTDIELKCDLSFHAPFPSVLISNKKKCCESKAFGAFGALVMPVLSTLGSVISPSFLWYSTKACSQMWLHSQVVGMCRCSASEDLISGTHGPYPNIQNRGSLRIHLTQKNENFLKFLNVLKFYLFTIKKFSSLSKKKAWFFFTIIKIIKEEKHITVSVIIYYYF